MDIFPSHFPTSSKGTKKKQLRNVKEIDFGDGYTQRVSIGINSIKKVYDLKWDKIKPSMAKEIETWLLEREDLIPFKFTYFGDIERMYICSDVQLTDNVPSPTSITATFKETFDIE